MENIRLTKLATCAGCGAKVGGGTLVKLLDNLPVNRDERLLVGYDKVDDAAVYQVSDDLALIQTLDFFPPIVDDPYMFGQIAACNALSDVYAMGGQPKLAMNIMTVSKEMSREVVHAILRGGYEKAYEAGAMITGGQTIEDVEPKYGLSVTGFVHPQRVLTNGGARVGDVLILTQPLGVGILTTAAKAEQPQESTMQRIYAQMAQLNKYARDIMVNYEVHGCTDITGFSLLGHGCEMAQASGCTLHLKLDDIPYHAEAFEFADMGFVPAGAYRNRDYVADRVDWRRAPDRAMQDILFDPQSSGGLLISVAERDAQPLLAQLKDALARVEIIGYVAAQSDAPICVE